MKILSRLNKNPIIIISAVTIFFFVIIYFFYYLVFIYPITRSKKSLTQAKTLATELKLTNSQILLSYQELIGINPSHPEYESLISNAIETAEKSDNKYKELVKKIGDAKFKGRKGVVDFLNKDFKEKYSANSIITADLEEFKKANTALLKVISYNPHTDIGNLDLNDPKYVEAAIGRAESASEGLKKSYENIKAINHPKIDELSANLSISIGLLNDLVKTLRSENPADAEAKRAAFLTSYADVSRNSTEIVRSFVNSEEFKQQEEARQKLAADLDDTITKIGEKEKNLPPDPLSKIRNK